MARNVTRLRWIQGCLLLLSLSNTVFLSAQYGERTPLLLADGLKLLEEKYHCAFLYETQLVRGQYFDPAWPTSYSRLEDILHRISEETSLAFTEIDEGFWAIQARHPYGQIRGYVYNNEGEPLIGASVFHPQSQRGASTDLSGYFEFWIPAGQTRLSISYIGYQAVDTLLWLPFGQQQKLSIKLKSSVDLTEVIVLGDMPYSLAYLSPNTDAEQLGPEEMGNLPLSDLGQLLQYAAPSFHSTYQTLSDGTDHIDPATLRGLGSDQLVVLVNGQRRHSSALVNVNNTIGRGSVATDLNTIPLAAIDRVEILPDGATAQYGSDAIAGVINIVLKDSIPPSSIHYMNGITTAGDGFQAGLNGHWKIRQTQQGYFHLNWRIDARSSVNRSGNYNGSIFGDSRDQRPDSVGAFFAQTGFQGRRVMEVGSAAIRNYGCFIRQERKIGRQGQFYQFGGANFRTGSARGFYRFPYQQHKQSGLYPWGFSPEIHPRIIDASWLSGLRRNFGLWQVDLNQNIGINQVTFLIKNSNNASLGLQSPTSARAGSLLYSQLITKCDASRTSDDKQSAWQMGIQWRNEFFRQAAGEEWSWKNYNTNTEDQQEGGIQVFPGYRPEHTARVWRTSWSAYLLFNQYLNPRWHYALALRGESWTANNSFLTGKAALTYRSDRGVKIRAALNTGLRPPSLGQAYFSSQSLQFVPQEDKLVGADVAQLNSEHPVTRALVGGRLRAERSYNSSLQISWPFQEQGTVSLTGYRVDIKNRIVLGSQLTGQNHPLLASMLDANGLDRVQFFSNAIATTTYGLDLGLMHSWTWVNGTFKLRLAASLNRTRLTKVELPNGLTGLETVLFNREDRARLEHSQPDSKIIAQLSWTSKKWQIGLQNTRFGSVTYHHPNDGSPDNWVINNYSQQLASRDQTFRAKWITDISLNWQVRQNLSCGFHARNIFNIYPDRHQHSANTNNGIFQYSRYVQQFGVWGTHCLLSCQLSW